MVSYAFVSEKGKTFDFSETIVVCYVTIGRCSYLNDCMILYEYQWSRSIIHLGPRSLKFHIAKFLFF